MGPRPRRSIQIRTQVRRWLSRRLPASSRSVSSTVPRYTRKSSQDRPPRSPLFDRRRGDGCRTGWRSEQCALLLAEQLFLDQLSSALQDPGKGLARGLLLCSTEASRARNSATACRTCWPSAPPRWAAAVAEPVPTVRGCVDKPTDVLARFRQLQRDAVRNQEPIDCPSVQDLGGVDRKRAVVPAAPAVVVEPASSRPRHEVVDDFDKAEEHVVGPCCWHGQPQPVTAETSANAQSKPGLGRRCRCGHHRRRRAGRSGLGIHAPPTGVRPYAMPASRH